MANDFFDRNQAYVLPGKHVFNTPLPPEQETQFRSWVADRGVPFDVEAPVSDYDMRGFWQALQAKDPRAWQSLNVNDASMHFPDYWKTPYHETFSNESQWATQDAPTWDALDRLVDREGNVVFDERSQLKRR